MVASSFGSLTVLPPSSRVCRKSWKSSRMNESRTSFHTTYRRPRLGPSLQSAAMRAWSGGTGLRRRAGPVQVAPSSSVDHTMMVPSLRTGWSGSRPPIVFAPT